MKKLNNVSRKTGFPITAEVLDVLNNTDIVSGLLQTIGSRTLKNAWAILDTVTGLILHIDRSGYANIYYCEMPINDLIALKNDALNNRTKYRLIPADKYTNISKKDGSEVYENAIKTMTVSITTENFGSEMMYHEREELIAGIWEDFSGEIDLPTSGYVVETAKCFFNRAQKKIALKFLFKHTSSFTQRVEFYLVTNEHINPTAFCGIVGDIFQQVTNVNKKGEVNTLPCYLRTISHNFVLITLDYSSVTTTQYYTAIDVTIDLR